MAYMPTVWKNRVVEKPNTFTMIQNQDGTYTLTPYTGAITEAGTPTNASNMNKIEQELVALDSNKLDSTSYTKEDVLAKLLLVDGAGSGLDADKFQGKALTDFVLSTNEPSTLGTTICKKFADGFMVQMGNVQVTTSSLSSSGVYYSYIGITFPNVFPNACIGVLATNSSSVLGWATAKDATKTGATVYACAPSDNVQSNWVTWYAFGY